MSCAHCRGCDSVVPTPLTETERQLLGALAQNAFLPVARFLLRSPEQPELSFVMSAPVYLPAPEADADTLRACGTALLSLHKRRYITLDYGVPLDGFDYAGWERSEFYRSFAFSVDAPGAEPFLEPGSIALTVQGQEEIDGW